MNQSKTKFMEDKKSIEEIISELESLQSCFQQERSSLNQTLRALEQAFSCFQQGKDCLSHKHHQSLVLSLNSDHSPALDARGEPISQPLLGIRSHDSHTSS